ncbi:helix-turn-helix domain-containing protein [Flavobacterium sp. ZT3R25]|uniref:helix-turn-helix domain-containing protein n=1 Tax=Flavobacterium galactosi TaxID=3398735 RepID=UPI003A847D58
MQLIIKEIRENKKLTQDEVVELSGIKKRTYVDYENGKSDIPLSKLQNIAIALKVNLFELFDGYENTTIEKTQTTEFLQLQFENEALRNENAELKKDKDFLQSLLQRNDHDKSQTA